MSLARILLTVVAVVQGAATVVIDLNRTHASHPRWPGHARFHVIWQTWNTALMAVVACWLIWSGDAGAVPARRFYLAAALTMLPCVGFVIAQGMRAVFGAALSDPDGIRPLRVRAFGQMIRADGNALCVYAALVMIPLIVVLYHHGAAAGR